MEDKELKERIEYSLLYDFYGALLKENQREIFDMFISEDYGYSEIADCMKISRQGVYDAVRRTQKQLKDYEEKLGLAERFQSAKSLMKELRALLTEKDFAEKRDDVDVLVKKLEEIL